MDNLYYQKQAPLSSANSKTDIRRYSGSRRSQVASLAERTCAVVSGCPVIRPVLLRNCRVIMARRDSKGNPVNSEGGFFALQKHMMRSDAWKSLTPQEVAVFIRVAFRFKGDNNGELAISSRDAAKEARVGKDTACKALRSLCDKGLLKLITRGGYSRNGGKASEYALTCFPVVKGKPASREYQQWKPSDKNKTQSHIRDSAVLYQGTEPKLRLVKR